MHRLEQLWSTAPVRNWSRLKGNPASVHESISELMCDHPQSTSPREFGKVIRVGDIHGFLASPLQTSARHTLRLNSLPEFDANELMSEPMELTVRLIEKTLKVGFWSTGENNLNVEEHIDELYDVLHTQNKAPVGIFAEVSKASLKACIQRWTSECSAAGLGPMADWVQLYMGKAPEFEANVVLLDPIVITVGTYDILLEGPLERIHPERHTVMSITTKQQPDHGDFLRAFITILALSARKAPMPNRVRVIIKSLVPTPKSVHERIYAVPPPQLAYQWLGKIVGALRDSFHGYRLPIEVVMNWYRRESQSASARVEIGPREKTQDDIGPIDDISVFGLPEQQDAIDKIKERFGLWFEAGHR